MVYTGKRFKPDDKERSGTVVATTITSPQYDAYELSTDVYIKAMRVTSILYASSTYKNRHVLLSGQ